MKELVVISFASILLLRDCGLKVGAYEAGIEPTNIKAFLPIAQAGLLATGGTTAGWDHGFLAIHKLDSGKLVWHAGKADSVYALAVSPDGSHLLAGDLAGVITIYRIHKGRLEALRERALETAVTGAAWSTDSVVIATRSGQLLVLDPGSLKTKRKLPAHDKWVNQVLVSPDGRFVATSGRDQNLFVWECRSWKKVFTFRERNVRPVMLCWSPDSRRLAAGFIGQPSQYDAGRARIGVMVWQTAGWRPCWTYRKKDRNPVGVAFPSDCLLTILDPRNREQAKALNVDLCRDNATRPLEWAALSYHIVYLDDGKKVLAQTGVHKMALWKLVEGSRETVWEFGAE